MDEMTAYAACAVVHGDENVAERWFQTLTDTYADLADGADWMTFRDALAESAAAQGFAPTTVEQFVEYLEARSDPLDTVADMHAEGPDALFAAYREWLATADQGEEPAVEATAAAADGGQGHPAAEDETAWNAYLAQNGPYWDGTEQGWSGFREWFLYHAREAGVGGTAEAFLTYADGESDRVALFAQYGVPIADGSPGPVGSEQVAAAAEPGQAEQDLADEDADLAAEVAAMSEQERAELLTTTLSEHDLEDEVDEEEVEESPTAETLSVAQAVEQVADEIIGQFRNEHPEFAAMTDDDIRELLSEIIGEAAGETQPA